MKSSNIGGQAVMEGVMMRNGGKYAVAVRKPDGEIAVKVDDCKGIVNSKFLLKTPFIRGIFNFVDSLVIGMKALFYSADFFLDEEEEEADKKKEKDKKKAEKKAAEKKTDQKNKEAKTQGADQEAEDKGLGAFMAVTIVFAVILSLGLFIGLPFLAAEGLRHVTQNEWIIVTLEGLIRLAIFILYIALISQMKDIKRTYMYHGAEHKCINCIEHGMELTVENVRKSSKEHKRCGTSFLLFVMIIGIVVGFLIRCGNPLLRLLLRLLMIPVVAGIAYELLKWAGNSDNPVISILSKPGLALQGLTTKEPDDSMIEVGIKSVEAVFDWRAYLRENGFAVSEDAQDTDAQQMEGMQDTDNAVHAETVSSENAGAPS